MSEEQIRSTPMGGAKRLELQSMPADLMALAKDQFGAHFLQFEIWVGHVIDVAFDLGKAAQLALSTQSETTSINAAPAPAVSRESATVPIGQITDSVAGAAPIGTDNQVVEAIKRPMAHTDKKGEQFLRISEPRECPACWGNGYTLDRHDEKLPCSICAETGKVVPYAHSAGEGRDDKKGDGLCPLCRGPMPTDEKTLKERLAIALSTPMDPGVVLDPTDERLKAFSKPERRRIIAAMCACEGISTPMLEATCPSEFDVLKMLEERVRDLQAQTSTRSATEGREATEEMGISMERMALTSARDYILWLVQLKGIKEGAYKAVLRMIDRGLEPPSPDRNVDHG